MDKDLITIKEYGAQHGVSREAIRQKIMRDKLPGIKIGRNWFIKKDTPFIDHRKTIKNELKGL